MANILYVDDEPVWRENVERVLKFDHEIVTVGTYEDAVDRLGSAATCPFDLVMVDLDLEGRRDGRLQGETLLGDLRGGHFRARVIVMSGRVPGGPLIERAHDWAADEIIYKGRDGNPRSVRQTVERVLLLGPKVAWD